MEFDCYFFVTNCEDERVIDVCCISCGMAISEESKWFWEGSRRGYLEDEVSCSRCGTLIKSLESAA